MKNNRRNIRRIYRIRILLVTIIIFFYTSYLSISDGFVIPDDKYIRAIRLEKFIDRFNKEKMDRVLIVQSTIEGGYVESELYTTGKNIKLNIDNSGDTYSNQLKQSITCKNMKREVMNTSITYILDQCENLSIDERVHVISLGIK
ncbi:DUF4362 domain-containing protein [Paenibacillus puerhi]|uniref:DUF4362 domain-containing protein n=1 Tax=Paenibacillus puerhi TaxID=2692622 RepID=UPI0013592B43|nr:DUF4362 domain-containing protein [Paenibacillus puerhi]